MSERPPLTIGFQPAFAALAEQIAGQRVGVYAGQFPAHRVFAMQAIAHIWRCATDNAIPAKRYYALTRDQALEELALVVQTAEQRLRRKPDDQARQLQLEQLTAMRWWHAQYQPQAYVLNMAFMLKYDALQALLKAEAAADGRRAA
jgi:hypothetical protein